MELQCGSASGHGGKVLLISPKNKVRSIGSKKLGWLDVCPYCYGTVRK